MTLNYILTKDEFFSFHKNHIKNSFYYNEIFIDIYKNFYLLWLFIFVFAQNKLKKTMIIEFVSISILIYIIIKIFFKNIFITIFLKNIYLQHNKKYIFFKTALTIDDIGIQIDTELNNKVIKWNYIKDFYIIDNNVLIRSFSDNDILIPESCIKSEDTFKKIINLFKKNASIYPGYTYPKDINFS